MDTSQARVTTQNGPNHENEDDNFERDLKEIMKDGPSLNDLSSPVMGGNAVPAGASTQASGVPRSMPPTSLPMQQRPTQYVPPATSTIALSSPERNGQDSVQSPKAAGSPVATKIDNIKAWSLNTYKCTKQILSERFGRGSRTVDLELEGQIEALRDTQRKYSNILRLSRALTSHFNNVVQTQRQLGDAFSDMSQKSPELQEEFEYNSETQKILSKNGETLLGALNFFTSTVNTLCNKTMEDTITTIKNYESARVEYDAYRTDMEALQNGIRDSATIPKIEEAQRKYTTHKGKFDKLRADVSIKLKFLEENKVKVMHKQLLLFHNAVSSYFSGNQAALEATLKQFNIKLKPPNADKPSWLEQ